VHALARRGLRSVTSTRRPRRARHGAGEAGEAGADDMDVVVHAAEYRAARICAMQASENQRFARIARELALSARPRLQDLRHVAVAATSARMQRRHAQAIGDIHVGAAFDERVERGRVARSAVAEHDGFDERRPAQVVDVIERRAGLDEDAHHFDVAEVRPRR
jgi:hypothetical protein